MIDLFDSLFKSFIQIYELLGTLLKNVVGIFKSLMSAFIQFLNLFKIIGITCLSFIYLCNGLFQASRKINIFNNFELTINNTDAAKNNVIKLNEKTEETKKKESFIPSFLDRLSFINK